MQSLSHKKAHITSALSIRQQKIYDFLASHHVGVLSTVSPNDDPHGTVIYYGLSDKFTTCFLTESGTQKYDNIAHNDHVMLTIFGSATQTVAQIIGQAAEVTRPYEIHSIAMTIWENCIDAPSDETLPITKLQAGSYVAFKIVPVQIRMAEYSQEKYGDYTDLFDSIESFDFTTD
jgi:general stress protein 26